MLLTPIAFDLRPDGSSGAFDNPPLSIGADVQFLGELQTDAPVSGGVAGIAGTLYAVLQAFQPIGNPPIPNAVPSSAFYAFQITNATPVNTPLAMTFTGTNPQANGTLAFEIDDSGTNYVLRFVGGFTMLEDLGPAPVWQNSRRLLFTANGEINELVNVAPSVYSGTRELRLAVRHLAGSVWGAADLAINRAARWYDSEPNAAAAVEVTNFVAAFTVGGQPTTQVSSVEPTEVVITFDSVHPQARTLLGLIRTDAANPAATWFDSVAGGFAYLANEPTTAFLPAHRGLPIFRGPATAAAPTTPPEWSAAFVIDPANIVAGASYRLVVLAFYEPPAVDEDSYSFITDSEPTLDLISPCPPTLNANLTDYRTVHPNIVNDAAAYERMRSSTTWGGAAYSSCRAAKGFPALLNERAVRMRVRIYEQAGPNRRILQEGLALKTSPTAMTGTLNASWNGTDWVSVYDFRIRWEANIPNLYDVDPNGNPFPPTGNQNWAAKTVYIEWALTLAYDAPTVYEEEYVFTQQLTVGTQSNCYTILYTDLEGNPIVDLCGIEQPFRACVQSCIGWLPTEGVIFAMVPENYALNQLREFDGFAGHLPQLGESPIVFADGSWDANGVACFEIDPNGLLSLTDYRAVIIVKPLVSPADPPCLDCFQFVGMPLADEDLFTLADCFLFDMRNNDLS